MSRDANLTTLTAQSPAATAGTLYVYFPVVVPFLWEGFSWGYQAAEANADNTLDFAIARDIDKDGTFDNASDALFTNGNANGLLDSMALGRMRTNFGNAAVAAATGVAVDPTVVRVEAGETIRVALVTAGTGTVPAINFAIHGHYLTPLANA